MYDLTKKIVERITEEIIDENGNESANSSALGLSGEDKKKDESGKDSIKIDAPEFSFIFTIALDGRLNISKKAEEAWLKEARHEKRASCNGRGRNIKSDVIDERYTILSEIFEAKDKGDEDGEKSAPEVEFVHSILGEFEKPYIKDFVSSSFIKDSVIAYWKYNVFEDSAFEDILSNSMKRYAYEGGDLHDLPEKVVELARSFTSEIKLFSCGAVSILIKNEQVIINKYDTGIKLSPVEIKSLLSFPGLAADRNMYVVKDNEVKVESCAGRKWDVCGFLNIFAHGLASHVFNKFFRSLLDSQHEKNCVFLAVSKILKKSGEGELPVTDGFEMGQYTNKVVKTAVSKTPDLTKLSGRVAYNEDVNGISFIFYTGDPLLQDEYLLYKQYKDNKSDLISLTKMFALIKRPPEKLDEIEVAEDLLKIFVQEDASGNSVQKYAIKKEIKKIVGKLWNAPLKASPYIGIKFKSLPSIYVEGNSLKPAVSDLLATVMSGKPAFFNDKSIQNDFLHDNFSTKTRKDVLVVDSGGLAVVESSFNLEMEKRYISSESESSYDVPYNTILFCFESIFAAAEATRVCNKELKNDISARMEGRPGNCTNGLLMSSGWTKSVVLLGAVALFLIFALGMPVEANCCLALVIMVHMYNMLRVYRECNKLSELIVRIRGISFFGNASAWLFSLLRSETLIKATKVAHGFGLKTASKGVNESLTRYEYILKNRSRAAIAPVNCILLLLIVYSAIINLLFSNNMIFSWRAIVMTFGANVFEHESLLRFIIRSVFV